MVSIWRGESRVDGVVKDHPWVNPRHLPLPWDVPRPPFPHQIHRRNCGDAAAIVCRGGLWSWGTRPRSGSTGTRAASSLPNYETVPTGRGSFATWKGEEAEAIRRRRPDVMYPGARCPPSADKYSPRPDCGAATTTGCASSAGFTTAARASCCSSPGWIVRPPLRRGFRSVGSASSPAGNHSEGPRPPASTSTLNRLPVADDRRAMPTCSPRILRVGHVYEPQNEAGHRGYCPTRAQLLVHLNRPGEMRGHLTPHCSRAARHGVRGSQRERGLHGTKLPTYVELRDIYVAGRPRRGVDYGGGRRVLSWRRTRAETVVSM